MKQAAILIARNSRSAWQNLLVAWQSSRLAQRQNWSRSTVRRALRMLWRLLDLL